METVPITLSSFSSYVPVSVSSTAVNTSWTPVTMTCECSTLAVRFCPSSFNSRDFTADKTYQIPVLRRRQSSLLPVLVRVPANP